jgi:hypothetical protein
MFEGTDRDIFKVPPPVAYLLEGPDVKQQKYYQNIQSTIRNFRPGPPEC